MSRAPKHGYGAREPRKPFRALVADRACDLGVSLTLHLCDSPSPAPTPELVASLTSAVSSQDELLQGNNVLVVDDFALGVLNSVLSHNAILKAGFLSALWTCIINATPSFSPPFRSRVPV